MNFLERENCYNCVHYYNNKCYRWNYYKNKPIQINNPDIKCESWCKKEEKMKETLGEFLTRLNSDPHLHPQKGGFILHINANDICSLKEALEYQYKCRNASAVAIKEIEKFLKDNDTVEIPRDIYDDLMNGELYYPSSVCKLRDWAEENKA